ncbi:hypothetical protein [Nocardia sp. NPDC002869]|uniref:hypothetical protein n=1 Tax=Nocardia sp. NPDC002869 TaxID=3161032 RepID=UPI00398CE9C8
MAAGLADMSDDHLAAVAAGLGDPALLASALDGSAGRFDAVARGHLCRLIDHLGETDTTVVHRVDANARTDHELPRWGDERIIDLVTRAAHPGAEVVLLPETALHTDHLTAALTAAAGVPVPTAPQVTIWSLCSESVGEPDRLAVEVVC